MTGAARRCYTSLPGTVDRSGTTIKLASRSWLTAGLVTNIAEIILTEFLGYSVQLIQPTTSTTQWLPHLVEGDWDAELEQWQVDPQQENYKRYVVAEQVVAVFPLGFAGRSGWFINKGLQDIAPMSDSYRFWQNPQFFSAAGVLRYPSLNLSAWLGAAFPVCQPPDIHWCGPDFPGYLVPNRCRGQPDQCAIFVHATTGWDTGYFEQLVVNHNLAAIVAYMGGDGLQAFVRQRVAEGKNVVTYWYSPDPLLTAIQARRVSFPDYVFGCLEANTFSPSGSLACDYNEKLLMKVARRALQHEAPEAYYTISRLQLSREDIDSVLSLTSDGGGTLSSYDAACAYVKSKEAAILADVAPPCISSPLANPQTGDLVFDPSLGICSAFVAYPEMPTPAMCLDAPKGTVDRSGTVIKLARRSWLSHQLSTAVVEILLREYLRYDVRVVDASAADPAAWGADIAANAFSVDIENRFAAEGSTERTRYENELGVISAPSEVGYRLRSAVYVLPHTTSKSPFADFWRFYGDTQRDGTDFFAFADVDLQALAGSDSPACNQAVNSWCGTGSLEGWYVPPVCQSNPDDCAVLFAASPDQDTGYFEQLTKNLGLHLVHAYLGVDGLQQFVRSAHLNATKDLLFQGSYPQEFPISVGAVRVSYPDYFFGCDNGNTQDPQTGTVACDYGTIALNKLTRSTLSSGMPEASYVVTRFTLTNEEMQSMMQKHQSTGGSLDTYGVACEFVRTSAASLEQDEVPDCIVKPKALADIRAGDVFFRPSEGVCAARTCGVTEILIVLGNTVDCQPCPEDLVPDANQTRCDPCPDGSSPVQGTANCACDAGARQIILGSSTTCELCPAGRRANQPTGATSCDICAVGTFSAQAGSTQCQNCTAGSSVSQEGASACTFCQQGSFQEHEGRSACTSCAENMISVLAASSPDQCVCSEGFFRQDPSSVCVACPFRMECPEGSDMSNYDRWLAETSGRLLSSPPPFPLTSPGYMSLRESPLSVYECASASKCPGGPPGTCGASLDTRSPSCWHCLDGLYWDGQGCAKCHSNSWVFPWLPSLMGPPLIAMVYRLSRDEVDKWGTWRNCAAALGFQVLNHYQITSVVSAANIEIPRTLNNVFAAYSFSEDPLSVFNPACGGIRTFGETITMQVALPLILLAVVLFTHSLSHVWAVVFPDHSGFNRDRSANVYFSFIFTFFVGICSVALTTFKCADNPNGKATLIADRSIHCYEGEWIQPLIISLVAVVYLFAFGALFFWATWTAPVRFADQGFRRRWKFLFIKFRPDVWWWALFFCSKSLLMNVGFMFIQVGMFQAYWIMGVIVVYAGAAGYWLPWRHSASNILDVYRCCALLVVIALLISSTTGVVIDGLDTTVTMAVMCVNVSPSLVGMAGFAFTVNRQVSPRARETLNSEVRSLFKSIKDLASASDDALVRFVWQLDETSRWHLMSTMRILGADLSGLDGPKMSRLTVASELGVGAQVDGETSSRGTKVKGSDCIGTLIYDRV